MTGLVLLTLVALLWFCYGATGFFAALWGDEPLPAWANDLLEPTQNVRTGWIANMGRSIAAGVWLLLAGLPQLALVVEVLRNRTSPLETGVITFGLIGSVVFLVVLSRRYRTHRAGSL